MRNRPAVNKDDRSMEAEAFQRNIWCPDYARCLDEAAYADTVMPCRRCAKASLSDERKWKERQLNRLVELAFLPDD